MIAKYIQAKIVPMLTGSPGMGKSAIVKDIAKTYNLKLIDLRLSQCDPTDREIQRRTRRHHPVVEAPVRDPAVAGRAEECSRSVQCHR